MPVYEFFCEDCEQKFEVVATLQEKEAGLKPVCPRCGCTRVHQVFGRFTVIGGSKGDIDTDLPDIGDEDFGTGSEGDFEDEGFDDLTDTDEDLDEDLDID